MKSALLILVVAVLVSVRPTASTADQFYYEITLAGSPAVIAGPCNYVDHPFPDNFYFFTYTMEGYFVFDQPTSGVRFALPDQPILELACPGVAQGSPTFHYPATGDPNYSVEVDFGGCLTGVVHVFTRTISIDKDCVVGGIFGPRTPVSDPISLGCDGVERIVSDLSACTAPPTNLVPADGATDVSINPTMTCDWAYPQHCAEGIGLVTFTAYVGTDPDNLAFAGWQDYNEVQVGPLLPNTTYYWRMRVYDDYWLCPGNEYAWSPLMSFTTAAPVPTETKSWGKLKADYREKE